MLVWGILICIHKGRALDLCFLIVFGSGPFTIDRTRAFYGEARVPLRRGSKSFTSRPFTIDRTRAFYGEARVPLICAPLQFLPKKGGSRAPLKISALGPQKAKYLLEAQTGPNRAFRHWPEAVLGAPAGFRKSGVWAGSGSGAGPEARVPLICAPLQ